MDRNSVPPKTKPPPPESSDEESESSDEETEDEEQAEGGSGFESGSDESTDTTKKKLVSILPTKQQSAIKAGAPGSPAKRTREANGKKDKEDEPPSKKKKSELTTPTPKAAPKPTAQQSDKKSATKANQGKPTPAAKEKPSKDLSAEKDTKKSHKKKTQSPAAAKPTTSNKSEDETPQKPKTFSRPWLPQEELELARELMKDRVNGVYGSTLPSSRSDPYWEKLMGRFPFMDKYEKEQRIERLCEKVRRMRLRYESLYTRMKAGETSVHKNPHEGVLWRIWHTIWGPNKATPGMLNGDDEEEEEKEESEEEEDESDDDGSDEDDEEEVVPTQGKGRAPPVGRVTAQKKAVNKKVVDSSSDDDESNKEDSPVKAKPPAVVSAIPAPSAGKQVSTAKSVPAKGPAKGPAPTAMDVDLNTSGKNTSQRGAVHNGAQGGHAVIPALIEKSVRVDALPKVSDEMRAENLALLRDMRGTCVKMVEEAKVQSLMITEKILEDTRVKTTQIVEEARVKSSQIMEELRLVVERFGTITGQNGRMNGSHTGRWNDLSDNPFQGTGLLIGNGALPLGDPNNLDGKWREQSEAEQGLLLQRLQLVQEQARIQQEGIRLKLNLQKQQALAQDKA